MKRMKGVGRRTKGRGDGRRDVRRMIQ